MAPRTLFSRFLPKYVERLRSRQPDHLRSVLGVEDGRPGEEVLEGAAPVVYEHRQEACEKEKNREAEAQHTHERASQTRD